MSTARFTGLMVDTEKCTSYTAAIFPYSTYHTTTWKHFLISKSISPFPFSALAGFNSGRIPIPICRYPDRFQKLIRASIRFSFSPALFLVDIFSVQVLVNRKRSNAVDIALFATGLLLYWVGVLLGVGNYSRFGNGLIFEFGEVSVGLVITKVCDGVLK